MIEWQQYPGSSNENAKYAVLNDRKAEITKGEDEVIFVNRYEKMLPLTLGGKAWWVRLEAQCDL
jgi:hypothetical protein